MFKKILIVGLLGLAQFSWGMEENISIKELEKEYKYFWSLENEGLKARPDWKAWQQEDKEYWERVRFKIRMEKYMGWGKTAAFEYAKIYGASFGLIFAHEFGHWVTNRFLLKDKGFIAISPLQFLPLDGALYDIPTRTVLNHFIHNPKDIFKAGITLAELTKKYNQSNQKLYPRMHLSAMLAAGPMAGVLASCLLLKANTFYNEFEKNGHNREGALTQTIEKPLFNNSQNIWLQLIAALNIQLNLFCSLYPWGNKPTADGERILRVLKIQNTRPLFTKTIGLSFGTVSACALGKSIIDAWKDKF